MFLDSSLFAKKLTNADRREVILKQIPHMTLDNINKIMFKRLFSSLFYVITTLEMKLDRTHLSKKHTDSTGSE